MIFQKPPGPPLENLSWIHLPRIPRCHNFSNKWDSFDMNFLWMFEKQTSYELINLMQVNIPHMDPMGNMIGSPMDVSYDPLTKKPRYHRDLCPLPSPQVQSCVSTKMQRFNRKTIDSFILLGGYFATLHMFLKKILSRQMFGSFPQNIRGSTNWWFGIQFGVPLS